MLVLLKPLAASLIVSATALFMCPGEKDCPGGTCSVAAASCETAVTCTANVTCDGGKTVNTVCLTPNTRCRVIVNGKEIDIASGTTVDASICDSDGATFTTCVVADATDSCDAVCFVTEDDACSDVDLVTLDGDEHGFVTLGNGQEFFFLSSDDDGDDGDDGDDHDCCCRCCCKKGAKAKGAVSSSSPHFRLRGGNGDGGSWFSAPGQHEQKQIIRKGKGDARVRTRGKVVIVRPDGKTETFDFGDGDEDDEEIEFGVEAVDGNRTIDLSEIRKQVDGGCAECAERKNKTEVKEKRKKRVNKGDKRFI